MTSSGVVRSDDLRKENHRRVLDTLRARGSCSPAGLSSATGLSAASISLLAKQLADQGIVQSSRLTPTQTSGSSRGRPQTSISLNANAGDIISLTLLLDRIRVQRVDYTGKVLLTHEQTIKSLSMSESALLHGCCNAIQDILRQDAGNEVKRIGVAVEGVVENKSGVLNRSPIITHCAAAGSMAASRLMQPVMASSEWLRIGRYMTRLKAPSAPRKYKHFARQRRATIRLQCRRSPLPVQPWQRACLCCFHCSTQCLLPWLVATKTQSSSCAVVYTRCFAIHRTVLFQISTPCCTASTMKRRYCKAD